jgi:hypothetical protein
VRIQALAIFAIGAASIVPAAAQTYDPAYPVCLQGYGPAGNNISIAAIRRSLSATRRHRASRHSALSIHILCGHKCPRVIAGIAERKDRIGSK